MRRQAAHRQGQERAALREADHLHHQDGIALDVRAGTGSDEEFACLHEFAQLNPHFGVHFPMRQRDRPHMEPATRPSAIFRLASLGPLLRKVIPCAKMRIMLTDQPLD